MKLSKLLFLVSIVCLSLVCTTFSSHITVDDQYDFKLALDYAFGSANIDTLILTKSGGVYTTTDTFPLVIKKPITIIAAEGLPEKPIFTHSDPDSIVLEIFRICDDITFSGVIFDGYNAIRPMKSGIRVGHGPEEQSPRVYAREGLNVTLKNCEFRNFYPIGWENMVGGHCLSFLRPGSTSEPIIKAGTVRIENCVFRNIGDEAIRISETEKYNVERAVDSLIVRNCTFKNIAAECIRFYADTDISTEDAYVLIEHLTIDSSATRAAYIKNNQNAIFRDVLVTNSHLPKTYRSERSDYVVQVQQSGSHVSYIDTFNLIFKVPYTERVSASKGGTVDTTTVYGFDPLYEAPLSNDYTLTAPSPAYGIAHDGKSLGDLKWATNTPTRIPFVLSIVGEGSVDCDPELIAPNYEPGTVVTLTAIPDSGWTFSAWGGDLSGSENPTTVTVNEAKNITATFIGGSGIQPENIPHFYSLEQNYPNPFNPTTKISFSLKQAGWTTLEVYNVIGQKVTTMVDRYLDAGSYYVVFDAMNMTSGIYFYLIKSGDFRSIKKMILVK